MSEAAREPGIGLEDTVDALLQTMVVWDEKNYHHCLRTAAFAAQIAGALGIAGEAAEQVRVGALLHDIGMISVELAVLRKPGRLDADETERVRQHPEMGAAILARVLPPAVVACAAAHHEQPDGHGYPLGLTEAQIPLEAMICRVADVLDALTTDQPYRPALTLDASLAELRAGAGTRYGAAVVAALLSAIERDGLREAA